MVGAGPGDVLLLGRRRREDSLASPTIYIRMLPLSILSERLRRIEEPVVVRTMLSRPAIPRKSSEYEVIGRHGKFPGDMSTGDQLSCVDVYTLS